ncbi:MAG: hypothetical protein ACNA8W_07585 [Bradymonadaceae bacterium]
MAAEETKESKQSHKLEEFFTGLMEGQWERTQAFVDDMDRLFKANVQFTLELQERGQKLAMENVRRSFDMMPFGK